jgi:hypothetical protein
MALTAHFDASDNDQVLTTGSTEATDGQNVEEWDAESPADISLFFETSSSNGPTYRTVTPLMALPCLDFNGSSEFLRFRNDANSGDKVLSDIIGASAKTLIFALYVEATVNLAPDDEPYNQDIIFSDETSHLILYARNTAPPRIGISNFSGAVFDIAEKTIALATSYIVAARHNGTNLFISLDGGAETSIASGATASLVSPVKLALGEIAGKFFNGRVGEFKIWNEDRVATLAADIAYFTAKWLPAAGAVPQFFRKRILV